MPRSHKATPLILHPDIDTDTPGHNTWNGAEAGLPLATVAELPAAHARECDQDVCNVCVDCLTRCRNNAALLLHGKQEGHRPYGCICGKRFRRLDVLDRHITCKNKDQSAKITCPHCSNSKVFYRHDHLDQHIDHAHRGQQVSFPANRPSEGPVPQAQAPVQPQLQLQPEPEPQPQHKDFHTPILSCTEPGCDRFGVYGFYRQKDLDEHMLVHSLRRVDMNNQPSLVNNSAPFLNPGLSHSYGQSSQGSAYSQFSGSTLYERLQNQNLMADFSFTCQPQQFVSNEDDDQHGGTMSMDGAQWVDDSFEFW
ncbi:hypothetical protein F5Y16DRAFT_398740 [Xylariaceae sp. FL0255]|nr:hypothetical protein F5Y16DRAFT_398740 [Xylariaceae sp. FL0255]